MSNDIQKFDPSTLMDGVKQRIKATFVSLIPEEQWEGLCKREIDSFFEIREDISRHFKTYSYFGEVCNEILMEISKEKIREYMKQYENSQWDNNGLVASELLKKAIADNASEVFAKTFANMFQSAVNNMQRY